jgi:carbonic anhydrase/acetyltransferase-like protein (isoleucine patch superfamily)
MSSEAFEGLSPIVHPTAFVHASAQLLGDVELGEDVSVWPTAVLRGDCGAIRLGARSNVQDGSVLHATTGYSQTTVGSECTIGHRVILHGCTLGNRCLIGMGSILLDGVELGDECFVAAGSLLTPGKKYEARSFIVGSPAKRIREVNEKDLAAIDGAWRSYLKLKSGYAAR